MRQEFIIFLDIDGVLNGIKYFDNKTLDMQGNGFWGIAKEPLDNLKYLISKLEEEYKEVKIIISSTWRKIDESMEYLKKQTKIFGFDFDKYYCGKTETLFTRGFEIKEWLIDNGKSITNNDFVIIDDDTFDIKTYFSKKHIIETNEDIGLTKEHIDKYLKNREKKYVVI